MARRFTLSPIAHVAALTLAVPTSVIAAAGNGASATGATVAQVVQPIVITNTATLSFGQIVQPSAAGTLRLSTAGALTASGGAVGTTALAQAGAGPRAGEFSLVSAPNRAFTVTPPAPFSLSSGTATMPVSLATVALTRTATRPTGTTYRVRVGATLTLAARQPTGTYTGTYTILAVYQ